MHSLSLSANMRSCTHTHTHLYMISFAGAVETGVCQCAEKGQSSHLHAQGKKSHGAAEAALGSLGVNIIINGRVSPGTPHLLEHFSGFFWLSASILPLAIAFRHDCLRGIDGPSIWLHHRQQTQPNTGCLDC